MFPGDASERIRRVHHPGISIEHPILSDQAVGALRNVDFMAEFHRLEDLASFDQIRVSFEYRKDLLFVRHLLRGPDEFAIFRNQPTSPVFGSHSVDLLHATPGAATPICESRHALREQVVEISDQPRNNSHGVPQQGAIHWMVNISFDHGRIDTQFLAVFKSESDGTLDDQLVDHFERRRGEPVKGPVESIMFGNEFAVEASESPESVSVIDPLSQFAVIPVLHSLQYKRAQYLLCAEAIAPGLGMVQTTLQIPAHFIHQVAVLVYEIRDSLQHWLQAYTLVVKFQIGKADLGAHGSCHFLTF
jgi:hypothetical protein